ncbi:MAG: hypothetical protein MPW15_06410 [Candidatus Manganitrophus sp.]|nr:hypothetical protein [Candidatus Manganitrophus sp.]
MEIKKVDPELAFGSFPAAEERAALLRQGYRMLIGVGTPEELREVKKEPVERTGLRYAEIRLDSGALSEGSFLNLEDLLFPREARPAMVCSPQGRRAAVLALVWDAIQRALRVDEAEARARQFALILPEVAKEFLKRNSSAYGFKTKLSTVEGLPFPLDDETLPGGFHRPS